MTTSWQVVASVTPQTTLWTPSTQTLSSMMGQVSQVRCCEGAGCDGLAPSFLEAPAVQGGSSCSTSGHQLTEEEEHRTNQEGPDQEAAHLRG